MSAEEFIQLGREWAAAHRQASNNRDPETARAAVRKRSQLESKLDACPFAFDFQVRRQFMELKPTTK